MAPRRSSGRDGRAAWTIVVGAGMFFLDPVRGKARRHEAARQVVGRRNDLERLVDGRLEDARNRVGGAAIESGLAAPPASAQPDAGAGNDDEPSRRWTAAGTLGAPEVVSRR